MSGTAPWWLDLGFTAGAHGFEVAGRPLADLAREHGTPLFAYSAPRVRAQAGSLRAALVAGGLPWRVHYALKANRNPGVLAVLRGEGDVGIDACSPREVERALACGFRADEVSATVSMPSDRDLAAYAAAGVHVNLDTRSAIRRFGAVAPEGTGIGLRVDPCARVGYDGDGRVTYGGTKFGLLAEDVPEALATAAAHGLVVDTVHMHLGWGLPQSARAEYAACVERLASIARSIPTVRTVNLGGGFGARRRASDAPLLPEHVTGAIRAHLGPLGVTVAFEPGTLLVDSAGVLAVRVSSVETKAGRTWVGVDAGHNLYVYGAYYGLPVEIVHAARPLDRAAHRYAVAGHINEAVDVFGHDVALPEVREGDLLAILPAGAYGSSMASDHCLRGDFREVVVGA